MDDPEQLPTAEERAAMYAQLEAAENAEAARWHYHPCAACGGAGGGACSDPADKPEVQHFGYGEICTDCMEKAEEGAPDDGREAIAPGDYHYYNP